MEHAPGFLKVVNEARPRVHELTVEEARQRLQENPKAILMDVREDREWEKSHAEQAIHCGKGVLERDLEKLVPDPNAEILMYCGGGYRSILTADAAMKMGYKNVFSIKEGYRGLTGANWKMTSHV